MDIIIGSVLSLPNVIGILVFLLFVLGWPITAYYQYTQSSHANKAAFVGVILLALCAIAALLLFILIATNILNTNNPTILIVAWFDAQILVNWWTSPDEKWVSRRKRRRSFIIMLFLSVILAVALVGILFTSW
ncbi:MAG: hypothetical protein ACYDER_19520 [Ktedonobacteraceae bacterium]